MIYAVSDTNRNVKIGYTRTRNLLTSRIAALQTAHTTHLELVCAVNGWPRPRGQAARAARPASAPRRVVRR